jgi:hypothetical protein
MSMIKSNYQIDLKDTHHFRSYLEVNNFSKIHQSSHGNINTSNGQIIVPGNSLNPILVSANGPNHGINNSTSVITTG